MPEYVVFNGRPAWGIGQLQTSGGGIFGQAHWLALSDVSPYDPERLPARIQVPEPRIDSAKPVPWATRVFNLRPARCQFPRRRGITSYGFARTGCSRRTDRANSTPYPCSLCDIKPV